MVVKVNLLIWKLSTLDLKITKSACYLSYQAWQKASKPLLSIGSALSYIVGVLTFIITPAILYLLGSSWQPFENVTAFPVLSTVTLVLLGGVGLFGGLVCIFVGIELRGVRERYFQNID